MKRLLFDSFAAGQKGVIEGKRKQTREWCEQSADPPSPSCWNSQTTSSTFDHADATRGNGFAGRYPSMAAGYMCSC